ncbi:sensor histidine kinase [Sphingomonas panacis]|nr:sensor histidine kinase [Sphingomonas panacis]
MLGMAYSASPQMDLSSAAALAPIDHHSETNHRLANSLQLLAAMVSMSAREVTDRAAQAALVETHRRIEAIGRLHRHLHARRADHLLDLGAYLDELGRDLEDGYCDVASGRRVIVDAAQVSVSQEDALALGILISELVGNACKYAYEPRMPGDIRIVVRPGPANGYLLMVEDRGVGRRDTVPVAGSGLGSRLIDVMTARLRGRAHWEDARPGTRFLMSVNE